MKNHDNAIINKWSSFVGIYSIFIFFKYNSKRIMEADKPEKALFIMRGLPGSGKSTKAKALAGE